MADREFLTSHWSVETVARFWSKVAPIEGPDDCALWTGTVLRTGYGQFATASPKKGWQAHRAAWELTRGPVPEGQNVLHHCDVKLCVAHLFLGTQADNILDMVAKNRQASGVRHGSSLHPESVPRGETHYRHAHPEVAPRGERHVNARLTEEDVREIRASRLGSGTLARRLGVNKATVKDVRARRTWRHI